jgi:hypothetical protein
MMDVIGDFRDGPRLATSLPVAFHFPESDPSAGWGRILNLSVGGLKVETRWPLRIGQSVYVTFVPRSEMRLDNLRAKVVRLSWEEGYYEGALEFDNSVDRAYLQEAIQALLNKG